SRLLYEGKMWSIEDAITKEAEIAVEKLQLLIGRVAVRHDEEFQSEMSDFVQTAFYEGNGTAYVSIVGAENTVEEVLHFSNLFEADGLQFEEPSVHFFTFNNPYGACKTCEGFGSVL